ncbi:MAG: sugar transferase [Stigonema ocellatum SAG 48.90 = DSM 106950]|nr:sugar transferase [Stigonema ocellatum SAG 48.90 = DSM 106950]
MTTSRISTFNTYYSVTQKHQDHSSPYCTLQWRRGQLLVKSPGNLKQPYLAVLDQEQSLVKCLKHSPINLVRIDPKLGEEKLRLWANACDKTNKPIFLHIPSANKLPKPSSSLLWWLKRCTHSIAALVLLLLMSPVMLGLVLLIRIYSPDSVFSREWHIGERGKLFEVIKFRTTKETEKTLNREEDQSITVLGRWMRKFGLDSLPQLFNVIRGEMGLVGHRCYTLKDAANSTRNDNFMAGRGELSPASS